MKTYNAVGLSLLALSLTACGGSGGGGESTSGNTGSVPDTSTPVVTNPNTPSDAVQNRLNQYASEGYYCVSSNICEKFDVVDAQYNGTYSMCDANDGSCNSSSVLDYVYSEIRTNTIEQSAQYSDYYKDATLNTCKYIKDNYAGCSYTLSDGSNQLFLASMSISPQSASLEYIYSSGVTGLDLTVKQNELVSDRNLTAYRAELPSKPTSWSSQVPELSILLDNSASDDWGGSDSWLRYSYNNHLSAMRKPVCSAVDDFSYSCSFLEQENLFYQCDYLKGVNYESCEATNERTEQINSVVNKQLAFMGFDKAEEIGGVFSGAHPVTVYDSACEPTHNIVQGKLGNLYYSTDDSLIDLNGNSTQDLSLMRFNNTDDWSTISADGHCSGVASVITQNSGANVNLVGSLNVGARGLANDGFELVNNSWVVPFTSATSKYNSETTFNIWAAGNSKQDWSTEKADDPSPFTSVWTSGLIDNLIVVGAIDENFNDYESTGTPGNNASIQSRWLVALGVDVLTATTVAGSKDSMVVQTGTSFAAPYVSRALALGKGYCSTSTYPELAQVLLDTANKSFNGYAPEKHGQGALDVEAFMLQLSNYCP